jgi:dihydroorotate dehydrogenase
VLLKFFLFLFSPEQAHRLTMGVLNFLLIIPGMRSLLRVCFRFNHPSLVRNVGRLSFTNPIGLAAGFDKDGKYMEAMSLLGFSHLEIGTVTPRPQSGNPKPRLFRLTKSKGLINRMGFNNEGVEALAKRLHQKRPADLIIGANIGKNKDTPNEKAVNDYLTCFNLLNNLVDYFTINVSSPNTPGLRALQDKEPLTNLLVAIQKNNLTRKPVFLKIAPDLTTEQLDEIIDIVITTGISGIVATNTTITRSNLKESKGQIDAMGPGGLSGKPLFDLSLSVVSYLAKKNNGRFSIIGVGGIDDYHSAKQHLDAGADLIQVYTGMIYSGPGLIRQINKRLAGL